MRVEDLEAEVASPPSTVSAESRASSGRQVPAGGKTTPPVAGSGEKGRPRGNYWDAEVEEYLAHVRERAGRAPIPPSWSTRIGRIVSGPIEKVLISLSVPLILAVPWAFPFSGGLVFFGALLGWFVALVADAALLMYVLMTGRPPTWEMIMARIRFLRRPALRW